MIFFSQQLQPKCSSICTGIHIFININYLENNKMTNCLKCVLLFRQNKKNKKKKEQLWLWLHSKKKKKWKWKHHLNQWIGKNKEKNTEKINFKKEWNQANSWQFKACSLSLSPHRLSVQEIFQSNTKDCIKTFVSMHVVLLLSSNVATTP